MSMAVTPVMPSVVSRGLSAPSVDARAAAFRSSGRGMTPDPVSKTDKINDAILSDQQFSREQATTAYERSSLEAHKQRDWEERMSNTSYKRAAAQLRELGINPYVLLSGFSGASTPSGATGAAYVGQPVSASSARASQYSTKAHFASSLINTVAHFISSAMSSGASAASSVFKTILPFI